MFKRIIAFSLMLVMLLTVAPTMDADAAINKSLYKSLSQAGVEARGDFYKHKSKVVVRVKSKSKELQPLYNSLEKVIYADTDNPNEGDYMKWDVDETETEFSVVKSGSYYYYTFTIHVSYLTTVSERDKLDKKVKSLIKDFKFTNKTSVYDKVKKVYDYVCKNVSYANSSSNVKVYSAYSALINKKAVCQGYSTLLYKIYKTMGIPTRVIAGDSSFSGDRHGWNIVKLGKYFYNVDSTWDSTLLHAKKNYKYFLKGDSFKGHVRWSEFKKASFYNKYSMASKAYSAKVVAKPSKKTKISQFKCKKPKIKLINRQQTVFKAINKATYQIKYSTVSNFKKKNSVVANTKKAQYKFKKLRNGVTYYVKVRARKKIGKKKYYSKWSAVKVI